MIQVWISDITTLNEPEKYKAYYDNLPVWRRDKADACTRMEARMQSVGAWVLREKMREYYGLADDAMYNLSHSGRYVMCAISDEAGSVVKIGCDIERVRKLQIKCEEKFCCEEEYSWLCGLPKEEQESSAIRLWVLKESFAKTVRQGLRLPFDQIIFDVKNEGKVRLLAYPGSYEGDYSLQEYRLKDKIDGTEYRLAVCSTSTEISTEICEIGL